MSDVNTPLAMLPSLLPLLRSCGVSRIKTGELEIDFHGPYDTKDAGIKTSPAPASLSETKIDPVESAKATAIINEQLPVDLRTDSVTDFDKILHWSSGPDLAPSETEASPQTESVPMTADVPIGAQ